MSVLKLSTPVAGRITSRFGNRTHPVTGRINSFHNGTDFAAPTGTPIVAAADGRVTFAAESGANGLLLILDHGGGVETLHAHCSRLRVAAGAIVTRGQHVADVGNTGRSTGAHLHFGVKVNGKHVDPEVALSKGVPLAGSPTAPGSSATAAAVLLVVALGALFLIVL